MEILSVDLGHQYLAYALWHDRLITYGIWEFHSEKTCMQRALSVAEFLQEMEFDHIIIEQQMGINRKCTQLQYALTTGAYIKGASVQLQHPITKFEVLGQPCETKNKQHKALSVKLALEWLESGEVIDCAETPLSEFRKKDDIADAINMLRAFISPTNPILSSSD
jgi:hypothetical protein